MAEVTIDRAIGPDITVSASYLYSGGKHLPTFLDTNLNAPNATVEYFLGTESRGTFPFYRGARPDVSINNAIEVADIVESTYNALVLQANKRFSNGLLFSANYTLSKSEDTGQNSTTFISNFATMVDPFNNEAEKGPVFVRPAAPRSLSASTTRRSYLWGIRFGGAGTFESGLPLEPHESAAARRPRRAPRPRRRPTAAAPRIARRSKRATASARAGARRSTCGWRNASTSAAAGRSKRCGKLSTS